MARWSMTWFRANAGQLMPHGTTPAPNATPVVDCREVKMRGDDQCNKFAAIRFNIDAGRRAAKFYFPGGESAEMQ